MKRFFTNRIPLFIERIKSKVESGEKKYAVLASLFLGDIALAFWRGCGFGLMRSFLCLFVVTAFGNLITLLLVAVIVELIANGFDWQWVQTAQQQAQGLYHGWSLLTSSGFFFVAWVPEGPGILAKFIPYASIYIIGYPSGIQFFLAMVLGTWVRVFIVNLFFAGLWEAGKKLVKRRKNK